MEKENRKIKYTKKVIREALDELLKTKSIKKITVKELTELADINRSTFYSHYETIEHLIEEIEVENANKIIDSLHIEKYNNIDFKNNALNDFVTIILNDEEISYWFLDENVTGKGRQLVHDYTKIKFVPLWMKHGHLSQRSAEYFYEFIFEGCIGFLNHWYHHKNELSEEELRKIFYKIVANTLSLIH